MTLPAENAGATPRVKVQEDADGAAINPLDILEAADVPIVALCSDLTVARFNRAAANLLSLRVADVGRSVRAIPALAEA
ncbi:MAG TPA: PAS domain-containing protein, partial [Candidatus Udaeobacter sp.]